MAETIVSLSTDAARHIAKVLRMRIGDSLILFDGSGSDYPATIRAVDKLSVTAELGKPQQSQSESRLQITLWHGICRGGRMDFVVQKATELGVNAIQPLLTTRGVVKLDEKRAGKRLQHWKKIAVSAAEQSGRSRLPEILPPLRLDSAVHAAKTDINNGIPHVLLHPDSTANFSPTSSTNELIIVTGPEGGFTAEEYAAAQEAGFNCVSLGPRVLRSETAPLVALGIAQYLAGDLNKVY